MFSRLTCAALVLGATVPGVDAAQYALLASGSSGWSNYRHQAEVGKAYQLLTKRGIPADNIVVMMYDDVVRDESNPAPGKLYAKPTPKGVPGDDVYAGLKIDYRGRDVTAPNFLAALTGNSSGVANVVNSTRRVLKSGPEDEVFVFFTDHGSPGMIHFPSIDNSEPLHALELLSAFKQMHANKQYKELVMYLETCYSASMFQKLLPEDIGIYAVSAANATNEAWSWYCGGSVTDDVHNGDDQVDGLAINNCLSDLFTMSWQEDLEAHPEKRTFAEQFAVIKNLSDTYHPGDDSFMGHRIVFEPQHSQRFGAVAAFDNKQLSEFMGSKKPELPVAAQKKFSGVRASDVELHLLNVQYQRAVKGKDQKLIAQRLQKLQDEVARRETAELVYKELVMLAYPENMLKQSQAAEITGTLPLQPACEKAVHRAMMSCPSFDALSGHARKFHHVVVNLCADTELGWAAAPENGAKTAEKACKIVAGKPRAEQLLTV
eukprot:TRINITY_DN14060_c0_g1_i1.p1 TRINITY_DN14060_c0_g1~~TRINITY_DN14060_c0_g1_i1.p1  ORF type:complete len:512 (-),score=95.45 TRINITY_DN14060_c0_g1_i1:424-1890(-)